MSAAAFEKKMLPEPAWSVAEPATKPLRECVQSALETYFEHLGDESPRKLYELVLNEVEPPLLQAVLRYTRGNQSKAAEVLGINRGTLRKKLRAYSLDQA
jgi:Fis family transcriptional regulator, factor for inversion stimulation protein